MTQLFFCIFFLFSHNHLVVGSIIFLSQISRVPLGLMGFLRHGTLSIKPKKSQANQDELVTLQMRNPKCRKLSAPCHITRKWQSQDLISEASNISNAVRLLPLLTNQGQVMSPCSFSSKEAPKSLFRGLGVGRTFLCAGISQAVLQTQTHFRMKAERKGNEEK